jgi:hypothetical protein
MIVCEDFVASAKKIGVWTELAIWVLDEGIESEDAYGRHPHGFWD